MNKTKLISFEDVNKTIVIHIKKGLYKKIES